jgi:hypothetical protein
MNVIASAAPLYQGYVDERSTHHVRGWLRNLNNAEDRLGYEVVLPAQGGEGERILANGVADTPSDILVQVGVGDGRYAFTALFGAPLSIDERDRVFVRPIGAAHRLELAPALRIDPPGSGPYQGYVDERSAIHINGWVRDLAFAARRVEVDVILPTAQGEELLGHLVADSYNDIVRQIGIGDGCYGFFMLFPRRLSDAEHERVFIRVSGSAHIVEVSPHLNTRFEPIHHVAMDIVNNCNLRCPFCVYDYSATKKTFVMSEETFRATLRLLPYVTDGNFWLSCLHEATLHPRLAEFIEMVPAEYRHKLFFTTNLAKRMPRSYFETLARSGISHINISLESLEPALYERMRKGARFGIFQENWAQVLEIFAATPGAPRIRYNLMAYRSNLHEIPALIRHLRMEKMGWQVEIRNTFDGPQIASGFRESEFLSTAEWAELAEMLKGQNSEDIILLLPPGGQGHDRVATSPAPSDADQSDAPSEEDLTPVTLELGPPAPEREGWEITPGPIKPPFNVRIAWDGTLNVYAERVRAPGEPPTHENYMITNINELDDPLKALFALT